MPSSAKKDSTPFRIRLSLGLAALLSQIARLMPLSVGHWIADRCGDITFAVFPTFRRNVAANVAQVLGLPETSGRVRSVTRRIFHTSSRNFFDLLRVKHLSDEELLRGSYMATDSRSRLDKIVADGRGALMVTAHFGPFDVVGQILWAERYPVISLTTRTVTEFMYEAVKSLRASRGMPIEEATPAGVRKVLIALRQGHIIGLLADRDFFQNGVPVTFFGRETTLPVGPARLARQTGAPIMPIFTRRRGRGYELVVEEPFHARKTENADDDIQHALQRIVALFERSIRQSPEQWVMFQRVWPEQPAANLRVFPVGSPLDGPVLSRGANPSAPLTLPAERNDGDPGAPLAAEPSREASRPPVPRQD